MRTRRFTDFFHGAGLLACVVFIFALLQIPRAEADFIIDIPPPSFVPNIDLDLALSINNKTIIASSTINLPTGTALAVSIVAVPKEDGTADWSPVNSLDGSENSQTYWSAFYLDFYRGEIFSDATFISGEQMNAHDTVLKTTSTVTFPGPGTYTAVLYDSDQFRDYDTQCSPPNECHPSDVTLEDVREGIKKGQNFGNPPTEFIGVVTFTIPEDPCATPGACASNVLFLPGIKGSHLYRLENRLWEPGLDEGLFASLLRSAGNDDVRDLYLDANGASARSDVYVKEKDILDSVGGKDFYKSFIADMDALKTGGTIADWEPIAYDWRLSLADIVEKGKKTGERISYLEATSTPYIEQELRRLASTSKTGKVTIVAHSNGGLVAKALLNKLGGFTAKLLVDDIIFVGVPQSGAPRAIGSLLYGTGEGLPLESFDFLLSKSVAREFSENSPMAYHLLPSEKYFTEVNDSSHAVGAFTGTGGFTEERSAYGSILNTVSELYDFLLALDGGREKPSANDVSEANVLNETLINYARDMHSTYDAWLPPSEITLYQVAGWGVDTVAGIRFTELPPMLAGPFAATNRNMFSPTFIEDGDGVVPIPSALMTSTSSPNVKRYWINLNRLNREQSSDRKHSSLFEIPSLQDFIKNIIKNNTNTLPTYISESQPSPVTANKKLIFILHSPLTLQLTDSSGNTTGLSGGDSVTQNISGATYGEFGEVQYIIAPEGDYTLNMDGQADGTFTLEMQEMTGNDITASSTIANVPTTANTLASLQINGNLAGASALSVDEDGDGATDITITPEMGGTVNYEPPAPEPEPEPQASSGGGGGGGGGGWESIPVPVSIATTTASTSSSQATTPVIQTVATSTPELATSTTVVQAKKKPPESAIATNNPQKAETPKKIENIPQTPLEIRFLTGQTASVYDAVSQQSVLKKLGAMVYNGIHSLWLALMRFF